MGRVIIKPTHCKACGLCITACKKDVLTYGTMVNQMGYHVVEADESKGCIGCKLCAEICPECAIEVYR